MTRFKHLLTSGAGGFLCRPVPLAGDVTNLTNQTSVNISSGYFLCRPIPLAGDVSNVIVATSSNDLRAYYVPLHVFADQSCNEMFQYEAEWNSWVWNRMESFS